MLLELLATFVLACFVFTGVFWIAVRNGWIKMYQQPKTVDDIARDIIKQLDDQSIKTIQWVSAPEGMLQFHHTVGRYLRNHYQLWDKKCPLTKAWHQDRAEGRQNHMVNGVDFHPQHPDNISALVLKRVWERVHSVDPT